MEDSERRCQALRTEVAALSKRLARADAILDSYVPVQYRVNRLGLPAGTGVGQKSGQTRP